MNILKYWILIITAASSIFVIGSCKESEKAQEGSITFWHFWSEPYQRTVLDSLIAEFEDESGIKVETVELSWNDGKAKLLAAFNSGTAPDVLELGSDWVAQFSSAGVLAELSNDSAYFDKFLEFAIEPCLWDDNYYAMPWIVDSRVMFYNKLLMHNAGIDSSQAPSTFQKALEAASAINALEEAYGFGANGSDPHRLYKKIVPMFWTYGGEILNSNDEPVLNSAENVRALEIYLRLSSNGLIETQRQLDAEFTRGNLGIWFSGSWLIEKINNENPTLPYGTALFPGMDSRTNGISFAGGEYISINAGSNSKDEALKFVKWLTSGENSVKFCRKVRAAGFPADKEYFDDESLLQEEGKSIFAKQLQYARMTPVHPNWLDMESAIENAVTEAVYGRKSAEEALDDANEKLQRILDK